MPTKFAPLLHRYKGVLTPRSRMSLQSAGGSGWVPWGEAGGREEEGREREVHCINFREDESLKTQKTQPSFLNLYPFEIDIFKSSSRQTEAKYFL